MSKVYIGTQFFGKTLVICEFPSIVAGDGHRLGLIGFQHLYDCLGCSFSCPSINLFQQCEARFPLNQGN